MSKSSARKKRKSRAKQAAKSARKTTVVELANVAQLTPAQAPIIEGKPQKLETIVEQKRQSVQVRIRRILTEKSLYRTLAIAVGMSAVINHFSTPTWILYVAAATVCLCIISETRGMVLGWRWTLNSTLPVGIFWLAHFFVQLENTKRTPHLKLILTKMSGVFAETELEFTNKFLQFKTKDFSTTNFQGVLVIPVSPGTSNVSLMFGVVNDSSVDTDTPTIGVHIPQSLFHSADPGWLPVGRDSEFNVVSMKLPSLLRNESQQTPPLHFNVIEHKLTPIRVNLDAKFMPRSSFGFWLDFSTAPQLTKPQLVFADRTRLIGTNTVRLEGENFVHQ